MGEHSETFTIDAHWAEVKEICIKYMRGFGYKLQKEDDHVVSFETGSLKRNLFTFSFEEAYKHIVIVIVGSEEAPVCTVSVSFSLPFLNLRKGDIGKIKAMTKAMKEFILISSGYARTAPRKSHP